MTKVRNDYRVYEETNRRGEPVWRIKIGGNKGEVITTSRSKEKAEQDAQKLNIDPWYFDRGHTRADRMETFLRGQRDKK